MLGAALVLFGSAAQAQPARVTPAQLRAAETEARRVLSDLKANNIDRIVQPFGPAERTAKRAEVLRWRDLGHVEMWDGRVKGVSIDGDTALAWYCKKTDAELLFLNLKRVGTRWVAQSIVTYGTR